MERKITGLGEYKGNMIGHRKIISGGIKYSIELCRYRKSSLEYGYILNSLFGQNLLGLGKCT